MAKTITLPINNLPIFEALALAECRNQKISTSKDNVEAFIYEFAEEAITHSFTPSDDLGTNPVTPKIAESFYKEFDELFSDNGWIAGKVKSKDPDIIKKKIGRLKGGLVNIVQLYMELGYELKTKNKRQGLNTDFDYHKKLDEHTTPEDYKKFLSVEQNKYARLYVATILSDVILAVFKKLDTDMLQSISDGDLWNIEGINDAEKAFKVLKSPKNRRDFVKKVRSSLKVGDSAEEE